MKILRNCIENKMSNLHSCLVLSFSDSIDKAKSFFLWFKLNNGDDKKKKKWVTISIEYERLKKFSINISVSRIKWNERGKIYQIYNCWSLWTRNEKVQNWKEKRRMKHCSLFYRLKNVFIKEAKREWKDSIEHAMWCSIEGMKSLYEFLEDFYILDRILSYS